MDIITYILARKYVEQTADALGAVRGRPCTIASVTPTEGGSIVTFRWTSDSGVVQTTTMTVHDGLSIQSGTVDADNHLIVTLTDGSTVDCGEMPVVDGAEDVEYENASYPSVTNVKEGLDEALSKGVDDAADVPYDNAGFPSVTNVREGLDVALAGGAVLEQALTVSNPVGMATNGKTYPVGTSLETILRDMLIKEIAPGLTLSIVPSTTLYDVVEDRVSTVKMKAAVTKNTYTLSKVEFYLDSTLKQNTPITTPGTYEYDVNFSPATNTNFTVKAIVYDTKTGTPMSTTKSISVKFVGKSYYGTVGADVGEPTEAIIKSLQNRTLKDTKNLTFSGITMDYGKVVYAYPAELGNLSSIKDIPNNIQYWPNSFTKTTVTVDSIAYNVYYQNDPSAASGIDLTFS